LRAKSRASRAAFGVCVPEIFWIQRTRVAIMELSITEQLQTGLQLMIVGMGIVFLFLSLLVGAVSVLPKVLRRIAGEQAFEQQTAPSVAQPAAVADAAIDADVLEAIQAAIRLYETHQ
jgi:oxaloacetate decarboxylase gamma subunit